MTWRKFIKALGAVQAAFDCLVLVVHHCGIVGTRPRGHTSLAGADDVQIRIERDKDGMIKATVEHAKDFEAGAVLASKLDQVELGTDSDGDAIRPASSSPARPARVEPKLTKVQQLAYDALKRTIKDEGVEVKAKSEMARAASRSDNGLACPRVGGSASTGCTRPNDQKPSGKPCSAPPCNSKTAS